jgi:hypothetical protein
LLTPSTLSLITCGTTFSGLNGNKKLFKAKITGSKSSTLSETTKTFYSSNIAPKISATWAGESLVNRVE